MKKDKTKLATAEEIAAADRKRIHERAQLAAVQRLMKKALKVFAPPQE
jgi:hypothetical protein